jgi:hypothetical protein
LPRFAGSNWLPELLPLSGVMRVVTGEVLLFEVPS